MTSHPSRRALLLGGTATVLTACGSGGNRSPAGGRRVDGSFVSAAMNGRDVGWSVAYPPGHAPGSHLPVVISLHGRGATHATAFSSLHLDRALDDAMAHRVPPFAVASVDGGDHGYWHRRADGTDAGAMLADDLVPVLARHGLDTRRVGLHGWSMGGYGALLVAGRRTLAVRAVAAASPALFVSPGSTPAGAYDSAADFAANDVYHHPDWLDGVPVRLDCGQSDPFFTATREFAGRLRSRPASSFGPGHHDAAYWQEVAPAELRFLGSHLG